MKRKKIIAISLYVLTLLWIAFIWINSMQTGSHSGSMSGSATERINAFLHLFSDKLFFSHLFIRKAAHFCEFALLSLLLCFCAITLFKISVASSYRQIAIVCLALPISIVVGAVDEAIQLFVDGRVGSFNDVMIDTCGALLSATIFLMVLLIRKKLCKTSD